MTDILVKIIGFFLAVLVNLVPDFTDVSTAFSNAETWSGVVIDFIKQVNFIIPLPVIVAIIGIEVGIQVALVLFWVGDKVTKTVCSLIP